MTEMSKEPLGTEQRRFSVDARLFELQMEQFWKNWAPEDKYEAARFQAELSGLVRQIYRDAQEPLHKHMANMLAALPTMPKLYP